MTPIVTLICGTEGIRNTSHKEGTINRSVLGILVGEFGHRHGRRGGYLLRFERECKGAGWQRPTVRLFPGSGKMCLDMNHMRQEMDKQEFQPQ